MPSKSWSRCGRETLGETKKKNNVLTMIISLEKLQLLEESDQVNYIGSKMDESFDDHKISNIENLITLGEYIINDYQHEKHVTHLYYDLANGYSYIRTCLKI